MRIEVLQDDWRVAVEEASERQEEASSSESIRLDDSTSEEAALLEFLKIYDKRCNSLLSYV